jgi:feruloyl esterase
MNKSTAWSGALSLFACGMVIAATGNGVAVVVPAPTPPGTMGPPGDAAATCAALVKADFSATRDAPSLVVSAEVKAATDEMPRHCLVNGQIAPTIGYRMWLPLDTWNGKFAQGGCGGRCGYILNEGCEVVMARGYACLAADLGHKGTMYDNLWAIDNVPGEIDFGFRATHVANITGKVLTTHFYGTAPHYSYYFGASTGGRQGLVEAQRFPEDFDGIIAGEPAMGPPGVAHSELGSMLSSAVASLYVDGKPVVSPAEIRALHERVIASCDLDDNLRDGFISDPRNCSFDPAEMLCKAEKTAACLLQPQVAALRRIYTLGPQRGSEKAWIGAYVAADGSAGRYGSRFANTYNYPYAWIFNDAQNPDIRPFKKRGGKLIIYQGWADEATYPTNALEYYETVERLMGGRAATQDFFRFYMIPGESHIPGNGGAENVDYLSYLEAWVERGEAPDVLLATKLRKHERFAGPVTYRMYLDPANVVFSRPVYPYPIRARYLRGDPNQASSFVPNDPARQSRR